MDKHKPEHTSTEPQDTPPSNHQTTKTRKIQLSKRTVVVIGIVVGIIVIAALALWFAYSMLNKATTPTNDYANATHFNSSTELITLATASAKGEELDATKNDGLGGTTDDGYIIYSYPSLKIDGYDYRVQPLKGEGRGYSGDSITAAEDYDTFVKFFTDNHYAKTSSINDNNGYISSKDSVTFIAYATYESADTICSVWHADASQTGLKNHIASVGCADKASYNESALQVKPFYTAYKSTTKASANELIFGTINSSDAKDGYKNAVVYQDDATIATKANNNERTFFHGLYTSAPGSSSWTYVDKYKDELPVCSIFKTDDLKKAFSGTRCTDADNQIKSI